MTSVTTRAVAFAKLWLFSFVVIVGLLAPGLASADGTPLGRIVVFGDSLSDPGNAYVLLGGQTLTRENNYGMDTAEELVTLIPALPYSSRRFSNGPTWIELLGAALGRSVSVRPAVPSALSGPDGGRESNYAVAGATAGDVNVSQFPLGVQVGLFLRDVGFIAPSDALYVIAIGGNDIRVALNTVLDGNGATDPQQVIDAALQSMEHNIGLLYAQGARTFLVWNVPDLGGVPAIQRLDAVTCRPPAQPGCIANIASGLSRRYNQRLANLLQTLPTDIQLISFDAFGSLTDVQAHPRRYGLRNASEACIAPPDFECAADRFLFWDGIHPTRAGHAIIAFLVGKALVTHALQDD